jgi:hypothetical protein
MSSDQIWDRNYSICLQSNLNGIRKEQTVNGITVGIIPQGQRVDNITRHSPEIITMVLEFCLSHEEKIRDPYIPPAEFETPEPKCLQILRVSQACYDKYGQFFLVTQSFFLSKPNINQFLDYFT